MIRSGYTDLFDDHEAYFWCRSCARVHNFCSSNEKSSPDTELHVAVPCASSAMSLPSVSQRIRVLAVHSSIEHPHTEEASSISRPPGQSLNRNLLLLGPEIEVNPKYKNTLLFTNLCQGYRLTYISKKLNFYTAPLPCRTPHGDCAVSASVARLTMEETLF
ncbi:hypothetical protein CC86DRAFT_131239 [Ophiobolus disseminans]|uniref:Uncharacterized protein n=1 Tax=Ophiobolus disseminans TaxID=1469910 RepID=A0A6A6ZH72_9PLEO|nr:hypothetical protein CC86DRAFT_131239 [Ophiobolus disseminans]